MARLFGRRRGTDTAAPDETPANPSRALQPDPGRIGISGSVPFVRLPAPDTLFRDRAARLAALAPGHAMEGYLAFLARVAAAQAEVQARGIALGGPEDAALRTEHGMPVLTRDLLRTDPAFPAILDALLAALDLDGAPEPARTARDALVAADGEERLDLALQVFEGAFPLERLAACTFVAAAMQVLYAGHAARLDAKGLKPVADGVCPCCGGAPVASVVVAWTPADKARYLACSLCGTLWNHVRIRCTACGSGEGIAYYGLDEVSKDVQVEACATCRGYIKHLHQHRAPTLDPVADDVASYGLDLKVAEEDFRRAGLNLLFVA